MIAVTDAANNRVMPSSRQVTLVAANFDNSPRHDTRYTIAPGECSAHQLKFYPLGRVHYDTSGYCCQEPINMH